MISSTQRPPTDRRLRLRVIWVIAQLGNRSYTERAKNHVQSPAEELALGCVYSLRQKHPGCVITQPKCLPPCSFITVPMFELSKSHLVTLYFPHHCVQMLNEYTYRYTEEGYRRHSCMLVSMVRTVPLLVLSFPTDP